MLLTDIVLGAGQDGRALAAEARRDDRDLFVLLTTGYDTDAASANDPDLPILRKPFRADALRAALDRA